jgi:hypothetical protein
MRKVASAYMCGRDSQWRMPSASGVCLSSAIQRHPYHPYLAGTATAGSVTRAYRQLLDCTHPLAGASSGCKLLHQAQSRPATTVSALS